MLRAAHPAVALVLLFWAVCDPAFAQAPVAYDLSFPEREHRLMQVTVTFPDLPAGTLQLRMSRSSPGRYATHDFAKNVFDVRITDSAGRPLQPGRPNPHQWDVAGHDGTVHLRYRIFGDRLDGTYLAIDDTHAHINMPAALMWARGLEDRPAVVRFDPPPGTNWQVATQLFPGEDPFTFTAPNLQYLLDSPAEVGTFTLRTFTIAGEGRQQTIRVAVHHQGSDADVDAFTADIGRIVREAREVFGEYPAFDGGTYTFIANYLPWASGDGMEHRNSTVLTSPLSIAANRLGLLNTAAHEFVHAWNVERIRPQSLEPFDFEDANISGELWFGEGFTSYYAALLLQRAGLTRPGDFTREMSRLIDVVRLSPGRLLQSAVEMSRMAPFVDAAASIDRTNFDNTFVSYYTWGAVIALGLDLTLRERTAGGVTLDDYMRALWVRHGRPGGSRVGLVARPYTTDDLETVLADVAGDAAFARDFFARYIEGHEVVDIAPLAAHAGLAWQPVAEGRGFAGALRLQDGREGVRVTGTVPFGTPAFEAGLARDDVVVAIGGRSVSQAFDVMQAIRNGRPGDELALAFDRRGRRIESRLRLVADPGHELRLLEEIGRTPTPEQLRFRERWLGSAVTAAVSREREMDQVAWCGRVACR